MSVPGLRICVWCLRNLIFSFVINACISNGLSREFNEAIVKKLFIPEKNHIPKVNLVQSSTTFHSSRNKINNSRNKYLKNESQRQRISSNLRLKRNTLLADEDLFEFMVRIANTPAEWERIRRVLSRIKQEDGLRSALDLPQPVSSIVPQSVANSTKPYSPSASPVRNWPSSEWIKDMFANATKEDPYSADDDELDLDESDLEFTDETSNRIIFHSGAEIEAKNTTNCRIKADNRDDDKLVPNSYSSKFGHRRVIPDFRSRQNSAHVALPVISDGRVNTTTTTTTTKETLVEVDRPTSRKSTLSQLETKRRHLKNKIRTT